MPLTLFTRNGIYYARGNVRGIPVYESLKTRDPGEAETVRALREAELTTQSIFGKRAVVKFDEAANGYVQSGGPARFIIERRASGEAVGLAVHFQGRLMDGITQDDLDAAAEKLCPGAAPATKNRNVYTPFIAIWNYAAAEGRKWAEPRKWQRPREKKGTANKPKAKRAGTRPVSYEYAWKFVSEMSPASACVMTALFYTGMRPIELFMLESHEVNVDGRWIVVASSKVNNEPRGVPMHEVLVPLFTALVKRGGVLFRSHLNEPYPPTEDGGGQISSAIEGARRRLKNLGTPIRDISPYTARHSVSTALVARDVHPYVKDQILGHVATDMSRHYTYLPQQPLIDAINKLPVIKAWANAPWLHDPVGFQRRFVRHENHGRRGAKRAKDVQCEPETGITE